MIAGGASTLADPRFSGRVRPSPSSIPCRTTSRTAAAGRPPTFVSDELTIIVAPVILGGGKRLFDGFDRDLDLEHLGVRQSRYATFVDYRVVR